MIFVFEDYELDTERYELRRAGAPCPIEPQGFNVLAYLVRHGDRVVTKQELLDRLWPDQYVSEATLTQRMMAVRKALGDSGRTQRYIKTIHGRGYRFIAAVAAPGETAHRDGQTASPMPKPPPRDQMDTTNGKPDETQACLTCGHANGPEANFCDACGMAIARRCPHCQHEAQLEAQFCAQCGQALGSPAVAGSAPRQDAATDPFHAPLSSYTPRHLSEKILASKSAMEGERKQVTVLFADVVGFTAICEQLDPEEVHGLMDGCFSRLTQAVHHYEGTINQYTGDGVMALFGAPIAHEDHPQRAVLAALAIQETMRDYGEQLRRNIGVDFHLRIGVNTGLVVVGRIGDDLRMDYTAQGDTVNLAARLQKLAQPGAVLVSEQAHQATRGYFTFQALGAHELEGHSAAQVFQVISQQGRDGRARIDIAADYGLSPLVGRQRELATLDELLEKAKTGRGQIVGLVGEAGMGKSRLLLEFRRHLQGTLYLEGRCLSYGQSILYLPVTNILKQYFAIEGSSWQSLVNEVRRGVEQLELDAGMTPYLVALLTGQADDETISQLAPEVLRQRTFASLRALLMAIGRQQPLVIAVEDPHWIDQLSDAFFSELGNSLGAAPILLLMSYRPGFQHGWGEKSYYTQVAVHPLTETEGGSLIAALLGASEVSPTLQAFLMRTAEGNPFYLEELTRSCLERGVIERDGADYQLSRTLTPQDIPATIRDVIVSRIDRLPEADKRVLQTAAVMGREFSVRLLRHIVDDPDSLDACLNTLNRLEFLYETSVFPEPAYMFKHVLTQDAAVASLLSSRRRELHRTIGLTMETVYRERLAERDEALAHHFTQGEDWDKAFGYLLRAGDKARLASANHDALAYYTRALKVNSQMQSAPEPAQLLALYEGRGLVQFNLTQFDAAIADFHALRQLARTVGDRHQEGESLCHLAYTHHMKLSEIDMDFVEQYAREARQLAEDIGDQHVLAKSLASLGYANQARGNLTAADQCLEASLRISRREGLRDSSTQSLVFLTLQASWQGHFQRAAQFGREGLDFAQDGRDSFNELLILANLGFACWGVGDFGQALRRTHQGIETAKERHDTFNLGRLTNTLGWLHGTLGDVERAIACDGESMEMGRSHAIANVEISALINLGLDYLALGEYAQAQSYLAPTLDRVQREGFGAHRWRWTIRLLIGLADLALVTGAYEQALRYVDDGLKEALATSSQKYVAKGRAIRGKVLRQLGQAESAGDDLQAAFALAAQLQSPAILYPIAFDLGQWCEATGMEQEAVDAYGQARAAIEQMAASVDDEELRALFGQSAPVQAVYTRLA